MASEEPTPMDFKIDRSNLYLEEAFTDLKIGSIRRLTPVDSNGSVDKTRKALFVGQTSLLTPNGSLPIQTAIQAKDLQQAIKRFPEAIQNAMKELMEQARKAKQEEDSRIIVPGR